MILQTKRFGDIEVADQDIYIFEHGLPGFEGYQRYALIHPNPEVPFSFLQSLDETALAFILTDPFLFHSSYAFDLTEAEQEDLDIKEESEIAIRCIVSVRNEMQDAIANLAAPLVLNVRANRGKQIILHDAEYPTKYPLFSRGD
jgi:flagellar assembly factor FliW